VAGSAFAGRRSSAPASSVTVEELLDGRGINYPPAEQVNVTFKKAPLARTKTPEQVTMSFAQPTVTKAGPRSISTAQGRRRRRDARTRRGGT
jgi:hypothetical protein